MNEQAQGEAENPCEKHGELMCHFCEWERTQRRHDVDRLNKHANVPKRFCGKRLADYQATNDGERSAVAAAHDYIDRFTDHLAAGRCMVFCGRPGTGKTLLACIIAESLRRNERVIRYVTVAELIRAIRAPWNRRDSQETVDEVLNCFRLPDLLVLDEVGVQFGTDGELAQLTEIIDLRYRDVKPTLVVSNCTREELKKFLGERGVDRLRENGGKVVIFDWVSRRGIVRGEEARESEAQQ